MGAEKLMNQHIADKFREEVTGLPFAIKELLLGNIVVGNFAYEEARIIGRALKEKLANLEPRP
jgi:hypothetical protein